MDNQIDCGAISRRDALKTSAKVAGVAAFATPIVMGVFSSRASAFAGCDPTLDSDAVDLLKGKPKKWNINCSSNEKYGRYNAQRTEALLPGPGGLKAVINFGQVGTDNFPVECSYYFFTVPTGWECSATFEIGDANDQLGCIAGEERVSVPGDCTLWPGTDGDTTPGDSLPAPIGAIGLPYCALPDVAPGQPVPTNYCVSGTFLWLVEWSCCPPG